MFFMGIKYQNLFFAQSLYYVFYNLYLFAGVVYGTIGDVNPESFQFM